MRARAQAHATLVPMTPAPMIAIGAVGSNDGESVVMLKRKETGEGGISTIRMAENR